MDRHNAEKLAAEGKVFFAARIGEGLTLRAVPIPTGIATDPAMPAMVALIDVTTENGGSTHFDCMHDLLLTGAHALGIALTIGGAMQTKDICKFERRPVHSGSADGCFFKTGPDRCF